MYEVRFVVSDYGIYEEKEDKLIAIMNNYNNARMVTAIMNYDALHNGQKMMSQQMPLEELAEKLNFNLAEYMTPPAEVKEMRCV